VFVSKSVAALLKTSYISGTLLHPEQLLFTEEQFKKCWVIWRRPLASWKDLSI